MARHWEVRLPICEAAIVCSLYEKLALHWESLESELFLERPDYTTLQSTMAASTEWLTSGHLITILLAGSLDYMPLQ